LLYADDIVIYSTNKDPLKALKSVQESLNRVATYLWQRGLELSPEKSNWLVFTRSRTLPSLDSLKIFGNPVPRVNSVRFLGIILETNLSGKGHLRYIIRKGSILLDIITSLTSTWWGSHPHLLLNLYRSIFRSSIEYGCHIFKFHRNKTLFNKL